MKTGALHKSIALVVDDHPETLRLLIDTLESHEVTVLVATDGQHALAQIERLMPDLILLDAMMPSMDGFETCRRLKAGRAADTPVIFMTGLDDTEHVVRGLEAGGTDYLTKPIAPDELIARIQVHLANARSARGVRSALDAAGSTMLAVDAQGAVRWTTPQAQRLLSLLGEPSDTTDPGLPSQVLARAELPDDVRCWIASLASGTGSAGRDSMLLARQNVRFRVRYLSRLSDDEILIVLEQAAPAELERTGTLRLQTRFGLTAREADVLYWLSCGKANRDIGEILGMSPRTVNKHLEHVYKKLGVESRAGAVASAVQRLRE